ncbi:MAG TPA: LuxR C-terminal-related transcriptional regulator [Actinomycetota bacterium]|nr:LuxR C-terminal-related transcriptional regulator [Actinomycetota bacterium]
MRQKAYAAYAAASEDRSAARLAARLCVEHFNRGEPAVAGGWLMRAQRHLREQPECVEHGFLATIEANVARFTGDPERSVALAKKAIQLGQRFGDRDVVAVAIHIEGLSHIASGRVVDGVALLDEAMTSVLAGDLSAFFTGIIYCDVIAACLELCDVGRAGEWSDAARAWCETVPAESPYPGLCRVNRAEVAILRGAWPEAEAEATRASEELMRQGPVASGAAWYQVGEARRLAGNLDGAEEAFTRAQELGFQPQPGSALLRQAQGKVEAARSALRVAVGAETGNPLRRARLLAAQVEVALDGGELDEASLAVEELEAISRAFPTAMLAATVDTVRGSLLLAQSDPEAALERLRRACTAWQELRLPYEAAHARVLCAQAARAVGDEDAGRAELRVALVAFEGLGAVRDVASVEALLEGPGELPGGLTAREAQVLRLVAAGKSNRAIAGELVISEHTVARHVQNIFAKLNISSRSAATAYAFEHDLV